MHEEETRQAEEVAQELRAAIEDEVRPLARRVRDMFGTVDEIMARKRHTPDEFGQEYMGDANGDAEMVDVEAETLADQSVEMMVEENTEKDTSDEVIDASLSVPKPDVGLAMERVRFDLLVELKFLLLLKGTSSVS